MLRCLAERAVSMIPGSDIHLPRFRSTAPCARYVFRRYFTGMAHAPPTIRPTHRRHRITTKKRGEPQQNTQTSINIGTISQGNCPYDLPVRYAWMPGWGLAAQVLTFCQKNIRGGPKSGPKLMMINHYGVFVLCLFHDGLSRSSKYKTKKTSEKHLNHNPSGRFGYFWCFGICLCFPTLS